MTLLPFAFAFVPLLLFVLFVFYAAARGWRYVRLLAASFALSSSSVVMIIWVFVRDPTVLRLGLGLSVFTGLAILTWPWTAPEIVKRLDLRW